MSTQRIVRSRKISLLGPNLKTKVADLSGVGPAYVKKLTLLGIETVRDMLLHFPRTYDDQTNIRTVMQVRSDESNTLQGTIHDLKVVRTKRGRQIVNAKFADETGTLGVIWFNQPYIANALKSGDEVILSGKVKYGYGRVSLQNPSYEKVQKEQVHTARIVPIYPETAGVSSKWLRYKMKPLLTLAKLFEDYLPEKIRKQYGLVDYATAVREVHFPQNHETLAAARKRLGFDELFIIQLNTLQRRLDWRRESESKDNIAMPLQKEMIQDLLAQLPFTLTKAQKIAAFEVLKDMEQQVPMLRMLEGDVGSGKTIVATVALFNAVKNGFQGALMAPTEILARQHYKTITPLLSAFQINTQLLVGSTPNSEKKDIVMGLQNGTVDLIIGTHALIQDSVVFPKLGLAIVDEQHRFGVEQRALLKSNGTPHLLMMTATPIPRSLALTLYGDQDLSIIDEMPPGRKEIITRVVQPKERKRAYLFIEDHVRKGRQVFVICPLIDPSDILEVRSATEEYEKLSKEVFPDLRVGLVHGKLKAKEKERIMNQFFAGEIDVLVSTSVVEVGVDVPNASIMMIEGADRFGLAQLHQFRGRVGRGEHQSYCLLFTDSSSSNVVTRLKAVEKHASGFKLAEIDLEMRGPGEVFGTRQSGIPDLKMASLTDTSLLHSTRSAAESVLAEDPHLEKYGTLRTALAHHLDERTKNSS